MNSINLNQNKVIVLLGYDNTTTNITLAEGYGAMLPDVSTPYNLIWWNSTDYLSPTDDPSAEIVKCIAKFGDTLVVMRSQQQTLASSKNIPGKLYNMAYLPDNNDNNLVTLSYYNVPQIHGKTKHDTTTIDGGTALPIGQLPTHGIGAHTGTIGAWANIDKTTSSITDITTRSHTSLTDIGTNSHTTIDSHIGASGTSVHGLGTMSTQASSNVSITGGSITGITDITVADGGTGRSTTVPYAPICGGTTTTDAIQSVASIGIAGQVLTSNGAGTLPTFQAPPSPSKTNLLIGLTPTLSGWGTNPAPAANFVNPSLAVGLTTNGYPNNMTDGVSYIQYDLGSVNMVMIYFYYTSNYGLGGSRMDISENGTNYYTLIGGNTTMFTLGYGRYIRFYYGSQLSYSARCVTNIKLHVYAV